VHVALVEVRESRVGLMPPVRSHPLNDAVAESNGARVAQVVVELALDVEESGGSARTVEHVILQTVEAIAQRGQRLTAAHEKLMRLAVVVRMIHGHAKDHLILWQRLRRNILGARLDVVLTEEK